MKDFDDKVSGSGGGGKGRSRNPIEVANNLTSHSVARFVDLLGEGPNGGLVSPGGRSIYIDGTPIQNANGSFNFSGIRWYQRLGTIDQTPIPNMSSAESEIPVGVEVRQDVGPVVRSFYSEYATSVRIKLLYSALLHAIRAGDTAGDIYGYTSTFRIETRPAGGVWKTFSGGNITIGGKSNSSFEIAYRIGLDPAQGPNWEIRVTRISVDDSTSDIQSTFAFQNYTVIVDRAFTYPYCHIIGMEVDTAQFGNSVSDRIYHVKGRLVEVPSNYDPVRRELSGFWDGTFKIAWTRCPTWCYRDMLRNNRYGLGRVINEYHIDDATLYALTSICDELVDDGYGGLEPRFSLDVAMAEQQEAYTVINNMASVFRAMTFWAAGNLTLSHDGPTDPEILVTNASVDGGIFNRSGTSLRTRANTVIVEYSDPTNLFKKSSEMELNNSSISRFGMRKKQIKAFGCGSRGQARRLARWMLYSEQNQTETLTYRAGEDHAWVKPGSVIKVIDNDHQGSRWAGRALSWSGTNVVLDGLSPDVATLIAPGRFVFRYIDETGVLQSTALNSTYAAAPGVGVVLATPISPTMPKAFIWAISDTQIDVEEEFRVLSKAEPEPGVYEIMAVNYFRDKFTQIENGLTFDAPPPLTETQKLPDPPSNATIRFSWKGQEGGAQKLEPHLSWTPSPEKTVPVAQYDVEIAKNGQPYGAIPSVAVNNTSAPQYLLDTGDSIKFRVRAVSASDRVSVWIYSPTEIASGRDTAALGVSNFRAFSDFSGVDLSWTNPPEPMLKHIIIYRNTVDSFSTSTSIATTSGTQFMDTGTTIGVNHYYWAVTVLHDANVNPSAPVGPLNGQRIAIVENDLDQAIRDQIDAARTTAAAVKVEHDALVAGFIGNLADAFSGVSTQFSDIDQSLMSLSSTVGGISANLTDNYLTAAGTTSAIAASSQTLTASITSLRADAAQWVQGNLVTDAGLTHPVYDSWSGSAGATLSIVTHGKPGTANPKALRASDSADGDGGAFASPILTGNSSGKTYRFRGKVRGSTGLAFHVEVGAALLTGSYTPYVQSITPTLTSNFVPFDARVTVLPGQTFDKTRLRWFYTGGTSGAWVEITDIVVEDVTYITELSGEITNIKGLQIDPTSAFGTLLTQLQVSTGGTSAHVSQISTAVTNLEDKASSSILFRAKAGTAGVEMELTAADDPINGPVTAARISAGIILLDGTVSSRLMYIDEALVLDANTAGFVLGKDSAYNTQDDGIYMGRTREPDGSLGFGLAITKTAGSGLSQHFEATESNGVRLTNANFLRDLNVTSAPTAFVTTQTTNLSAGVKTIDVTLMGSGGGGASAGNTPGAGAPGGATTVEILDGVTVVQTWVASGGYGGSAAHTNGNGTPGQNSPWGTGGAGGTYARSGTTVIPAGEDSTYVPWYIAGYNGGSASGYGAAGGGGGDNDAYNRGSSGRGGGAGQFFTISGFDVSGLVDPKIRVTILGPGAGNTAGNADGGNGSGGRVVLRQAIQTPVVADVIPLAPTATGSMPSNGPFPALGAGYWELTMPINTTTLGMGAINAGGHRVEASNTRFVSFVSPVTPVVAYPQGTGRTVYYNFRKMGP